MHGFSSSGDGKRLNLVSEPLQQQDRGGEWPGDQAVTDGDESHIGTANDGRRTLAEFKVHFEGFSRRL